MKYSLTSDLIEDDFPDNFQQCRHLYFTNLQHAEGDPADLTRK